MYSSRLTTLAAICVVAAAVGTAGASGSGTKGEPVFQGSLGPQSTSLQSKQLDPAQIALVHVGARTDEPSVVQQGLGHDPWYAYDAALRKARHQQQHAINSIQPTSPWYAYDAALRKAQHQQQHAINRIQPTSPWYAYDAALRKAQLQRNVLQAKRIR